MSKNVKWSESEDNLIISLRAKNKTYKEIAELLTGRTYNSTRVRGAYLINKGKMPGTKNFRISWDCEAEQELVRLKVVERLSYKEIAQRLYSTESAIKNKLHLLYTKEKIYTDRELLDFVKTYKKPSTMHKAHKSNPNKVPSHLLVLNRFGTWYRATKYIENSNTECYLYYVKITSADKLITYYKIGVTTKDIKSRLRYDSDKDIKCLLFEKYPTQEKARREEKIILKAFSEYKAKNYNFLKSGGNSELFNTDILNLDIDSRPQF